MSDLNRAYSRGYYAGLRGRWPEHKPPMPPDEVLANVLRSSRELRDVADYICATLCEDDDLAIQLAPKIDALDEAMTVVTIWLSDKDYAVALKGARDARGGNDSRGATSPLVAPATP